MSGRAVSGTCRLVIPFWTGLISSSLAPELGGPVYAKPNRVRSTGRSLWEEAEALRRKTFRQASLESWVLSAVTRGALRFRSAQPNSYDSLRALALIPKDAPACAPTCLQPIVYDISGRSNAGWVRKVETSKAITLSEHPHLPNHRHRNYCPNVWELGCPKGWESSCE